MKDLLSTKQFSIKVLGYYNHSAIRQLAKFHKLRPVLCCHLKNPRWLPSQVDELKNKIFSQTKQKSN